MLSVVVIAYNEAKHIGPCLESARLVADEMVLVDSYSRDGTAEIARKAGAIVCQHTFRDFADLRGAALEAANGDWVFFLDADERVDERVADEVRSEIARSDADPNGPVLFWIPRRNYLFGKLIRHTGWSPDFQPRVMRKARVHYDPGRLVHELVIADGPQAYLKELLTHYNYETVAQFRKKQRAYTRLEAKMLYQEGVRPRLRGFVGQPVREFVRRFVLLEGWRDGAYGLLLSGLMGYYAFVRQQMLAEMWRGAG